MIMFLTSESEPYENNLIAMLYVNANWLWTWAVQDKHKVKETTWKMFQYLDWLETNRFYYSWMYQINSIQDVCFEEQ